MRTWPFNASHQGYRRRLRSFLADRVVPQVDQWEADRRVPKDIWRAMGRAGLLCPCVSPVYGGMGGDFLHACVLAEELALTNHAGLMAQLHSDIVVPYIASYGSEKLRRRFLPGCVSGDCITAVAMTEPDAGSDLASMTTTAEESGGQVVISGTKTFISNAVNCDLVVLAAKNPDIADAHRAISLYLVEDGTAGFKKGPPLAKMGMHSQDTAELFFSDCRIPLENRLGQKGAGFRMLMQKLQQERLVCAVWATAAAHFALQWTLNWCRSRPEPHPQSLQAERFALAEMATEVQVGRTFAYRLALAHQQQRDIGTEAAMAKFWCTDLVKRVTTRCLDLLGPEGTREACPVVRTWRDARVMPIFAGTNEIMKAIVAKALS